MKSDSFPDRQHVSAAIDPMLDNMFTSLRNLSDRVASFQANEPACQLIHEAIALGTGITEYLSAASGPRPVGDSATAAR